MASPTKRPVALAPAVPWSAALNTGNVDSDKCAFSMKEVFGTDAEEHEMPALEAQWHQAATPYWDEEGDAAQEVLRDPRMSTGQNSLLHHRSRAWLEMCKQEAAAHNKRICAVVADHLGDEIGFDRVAGTNLFFLRAARGKVRTLHRTKEYASLTLSHRRSLAYHVPRLLAHQTKEMPVAGVVMVRYPWPANSDQMEVGYLAVAGANTTPADDLRMCRSVLLKFGLEEGPRRDDGVGVFEFPRELRSNPGLVHSDI